MTANATHPGRITIPGTDVGVKGTLVAEPQTENMLLALDDRLALGPVKVDTDPSGTLEAPGLVVPIVSGVLWLLRFEPHNGIPEFSMGIFNLNTSGADLRDIAPMVLHTISETEWVDLADLIAGGGGVGGVTDHGALTGLGDDDHTQYHNNARGDVRYYTKAGADAAFTSPAEAESVAAALDDEAALRTAFGNAAGEVISPWEYSPALGPELWTLATMQAGTGYNNTLLAPSYPANGTAYTRKTRMNVGTMANLDTPFRLQFDYDHTANGTADITVALTDSGATVHAGTVRQFVVGKSSPRKTGKFVYYFKPVTVAAGTYVEVQISFLNDATTGSISISNASLRQAGDVTPPMLVSKHYAGGIWPYVYFNHRDANGDRKVAELSFEQDGLGSTVSGSLNGVMGFYSDQPWLHRQPDPYLLTANDNTVGSEELNLTSAQPRNALRANNNDQILDVWNGTAFEYRGNTHGGESARGAGVTYRIDAGDGVFVPWTPDHGLRPVRRFQVDSPTQIVSSTGGGPFANVDHLMTVFPDGVTRMDRTTTFLKDTQLKDFFEWMSSHDITVPMVGRIGKGLYPTDEVDIHPKVAKPAAPTVVTSASGGTLAAGTYSYRVAALSAHGETVASPAATVVAAGTTSSNTVSWTAVTNATGYAVYGRVANVERLLAQVTTLSYVDTGAAILGAPPPRGTSTAWLYNNTTEKDSIHSSEAMWAVWRDPRTGWCQANIYDRDSALARPQVKGVRTRLEAGGGIVKNYINLFWDPGAVSVTVPTGTVWTATHYSMTYQPQSATDYHVEAAVRAAHLSALKPLYPTGTSAPR